MLGLKAIVGQDAAVAVLARALAAGKLASAYLFEGMAGVGKASFALALAQATSCERAPGWGCGVCEPCRKIASGLHPDFLRISPDGQFIKIAQIRQVTARAGYRPHEGQARIVVLDPADAMNLEAANALLKTLEEPPAGTHFILISAAPERLPLTVRSRCQRVRFVPLARAHVASWLERERGLAAADAEVVAALSGGSLSLAGELAEGGAWAARRAEVARIEQAVEADGMGAVLLVATELKDDKASLPASLELLRVRYRDALLSSLGADEGRLVHDAAEVAPLATLGPDRLQRRIATVAEAELALRSNVSPQLCLERMMLRLREC